MTAQKHFWARSIVGTNSKHDLSRLRGNLADGILFLPLSKKDISELRESVGLKDRDDKSYQMLLLIREDVYSRSSVSRTKSAYFQLLKQISVFVRISVDPSSFIAKSAKPTDTHTEKSLDYKWNNIYSNSWVKFIEVYDSYKTTFELYSASTVTDRTDIVYNIMNSVISLESTLLHGEKSENAYKFRLRGAYILGGNSDERKLIYKFLKLTYELRSSIVHSNDSSRRKLTLKFKNDYGLNLHGVNSELIKMNRFILKLFVNQPELFSNLDDLVLLGGVSGEKYDSSVLKRKIKFKFRQKLIDLSKSSKK